MPIACPITVRNISREEFDERDAVVMRCAYASQNALGRLCDERVYENDLALRLRAEGFKSVHTQVPVTLSHGSFQKEYRLDLVADDALYELKTVADFLPQHDTQALHYAMLVSVGHAKLLNFRTPLVQGRLRFNTLTPERRRQLTWEYSAWRALSPECAALNARVRDLLADWGAFLESHAYEDALVHFCGGEALCVRRVPVVRDGVELGTHAVNCHTKGLAFVVTALTSTLAAQRSHLQKLLNLTPLNGLQWLNLNHATIQIVTLEKNDNRMGASE